MLSALMERDILLTLKMGNCFNFCFSTIGHKRTATSPTTLTKNVDKVAQQTMDLPAVFPDGVRKCNQMITHHQWNWFRQYPREEDGRKPQSFILTFTELEYTYFVGYYQTRYLDYFENYSAVQIWIFIP